MASKQYEWDAKFWGSGKVNAEEVGPVLEGLAEQHGDFLTPAIVVEAAKPKNSVLHEGFEWSDKQAAVEFRLSQARAMVRSLRIVRVDSEDLEPRRVFLNVQSGGLDGDQSYATVPKILSDDLIYKKVLQSAVSNLRAWQRRYKDLQELKHVHSAIDRISI